MSTVGATTSVSAQMLITEIEEAHSIFLNCLHLCCIFNYGPAVGNLPVLFPLHVINDRIVKILFHTHSLWERRRSNPAKKLSE